MYMVDSNNYDSTNVYNIIKETVILEDVIHMKKEYKQPYFKVNYNREVKEIIRLIKLYYKDYINEDIINELTKLLIPNTITRQELHYIKDNLLDKYLTDYTFNKNIILFLKDQYNKDKDTELLISLVDIIEDFEKLLNEEIIRYYKDNIPPNYVIEYDYSNGCLNFKITGINYDIVSILFKRLNFKHDLYFEQYFSINLEL